MIKKISLFFVLLFLLEGCTKVDTNPSSSFCKVQKDISKLTGQNVYWDSSLRKKIKCISVKRLLEKELTEDFCVKIDQGFWLFQR